MEAETKTTSKKTKPEAATSFAAPGAGAEKVFKAGVEKMYAGFADLNAQSKTNLEAISASTAAAAKGAESLAAQSVSFFKASIDRHMEAMKALAGVRSAQEAIELQQAFAKTSFDAYVSEVVSAAKTASTALEETVRPLSERAAAFSGILQPVR